MNFRDTGRVLDSSGGR